MTEAVEWRDTSEDSLDSLEQEFLAASEHLHARQRAAGRRRTRFMIAGVGMAAVLVWVVGLSGFLYP